MNAGALSRLVQRLVIVVASGFLLAPTVSAFETLNGRLQAHGYFEMQLRTINKNYTDQWDLTMWYNVFDLELELEPEMRLRLNRNLEEHPFGESLSGRQPSRQAHPGRKGEMRRLQHQRVDF